ncbi:MAG: universal stress protein [Terracidiphilus sp.]|jgi:nucleotide-binding universal stress UspA family protein
MPDSFPSAVDNAWSHPAAILVATDLADLDRLMPFALDQAMETGAHLFLLHVLAAGTGMAMDAVGLPYYDPTAALDLATRTLDPWCALAHRKGIGCDAIIREGHPAHQVAEVLRQFKADRVLLGTRSRSKLGKLLLGSVAEQVLRSVNLPVITVGPEAHLPVVAQPRVVLHATTLRETSIPSAALACRIAAIQRARLVLLHVLPPTEEPGVFHPFAGKTGQSGQPASLDAAALHELNLFMEKTAADCFSDIVPQVVHGNPCIEILAAAAECHASLIVLAATERSIFQNLTRDRTIYRVLAHARCPVLTLREPISASIPLKEQLSSIHQ